MLKPFCDMWRCLIAVTIILSACSASAQTSVQAKPVIIPKRTPEQKQVLADLAYVMGESHALRQRCAGASNAFWRDKMEKLILTEQADNGFKSRLAERFNAGYVATNATYAACSPESRAAERESAERGETLAHKIARAQPGG